MMERLKRVPRFVWFGVGLMLGLFLASAAFGAEPEVPPQKPDVSFCANYMPVPIRVSILEKLNHLEVATLRHNAQVFMALCPERAKEFNDWVDRMNAQRVSMNTETYE